MGQGIETRVLGTKSAEITTEQNIIFDVNDSSKFSDRKRYKSLVRKLIYLTITTPNISFVVSVTSQVMEAPENVH